MVWWCSRDSQNLIKTSFRFTRPCRNNGLVNIGPLDFDLGSEKGPFSEIYENAEFHCVLHGLVNTDLFLVKGYGTFERDPSKHNVFLTLTLSKHCKTRSKKQTNYDLGPLWDHKFDTISQTIQTKINIKTQN